MTPGARVQAAIEVLDDVLAGTAAERALTRWARSSRYAGSGDRAAVRDHVYDALRKRRSAAACGGALTGRGLMIGLLRLSGIAPETLFDGAGHGPAPRVPGEEGRPPDELSPEDAADMPDWLHARFVADLGPEAGAVMQALRERAPVFLRVNLARTTRDAAAAALAEDGIAAQPHATVETALHVVSGARRLRQSGAYAQGLVELQDASSQAAVLALDLAEDARVLDFCAGGGGKALALAARGAGEVVAHDAEPRRMADLPARAGRAGVAIDIRADLSAERDGLFDLVFVDAPCSGSGTWRRDPDAKWRLTPERLNEFVALQRRILGHAAAFVAPGGQLAYATCSVFEAENGAVVEAALADLPRIEGRARHRWLPGAWGDGFHLMVMRRAK